MPELLLELLSEEIPARMQERAAADLGELVGRSLTEADLRYEQIGAFATPRRLALRVQGLPARQADVMVERRGPRVGAPQAALDGFIGVARRERLRARGAGRPEGQGARRPLPTRRPVDARGVWRR